ncbi:hypothetical protein TUM4249_16140 [Shewanella sp. KT0246]|nr:hypothetical protein TUM4249_16140 [Shewanella sp. KT0246]
MPAMFSPNGKKFIYKYNNKPHKYVFNKDQIFIRLGITTIQVIVILMAYSIKTYIKLLL